MKVFDIYNFYWVVAGDSAQVYSSRLRNYVPVSDADYTAWASDGTKAIVIDTEANLGGVFATFNALRPIPQAVLDGYLDEQMVLLAAQLDFALWTDLYKNALSLSTPQEVLAHIRSIL
jgi:hypothetical protein